jgi:hypothetical protein
MDPPKAHNDPGVTFHRGPRRVKCLQHTHAKSRLPELSQIQAASLPTIGIVGLLPYMPPTFPINFEFSTTALRHFDDICPVCEPWR